MKHDYREYIDIVGRNEYSFKHCGVDTSTLWHLSGCDITLTTRHYFGRKLISEETEKVDEMTYAYICSSVGFFGDRLTRNYTRAGYIPTEFRCRNQHNGERYVRIFRIK